MKNAPDDEADLAALYGEDCGIVEEPWFAPDEPAPWEDGAGEAVGDLDVAGWRGAQADLAMELAEAAAARASLETRLRHAPLGLRRRVAHAHLLRLAWQFGPRLPKEMTGLVAEGAVPGPDRDGSRDVFLLQWAVRQLLGPALDLSDADRAWRRLMPGRSPDAAATAPAVSDRSGWPGLRDPEEGRLAFEDWAAAVRDAGGVLHPVARGAHALTLWRGFDLDRHEPDLVRAVAASMVGAGQGGLSFVPASGPVGQPWLQTGSPRDRLASWLASVTEACRSLSLDIDRVTLWRDRALATGGPASLRPVIDLLAEYPFATVGTAITLRGLSRPTAQRAFLRLEELGLARQVEPKARYRFWLANV